MSQASDAKLEEYCLVAKGSKGRTVADIIQRATSDPVLFAFGELLSLASVQQVFRLSVGIAAGTPLLAPAVQSHGLLARSCPAPIRHRVTGPCSYLPTAPGPRIKVQQKRHACGNSLFSKTAFVISFAGAQHQYMPLSSVQQLKLRQLTLVSMAATSKVTIGLLAT